jgi:hypothetical protein
MSRRICIVSLFAFPLAAFVADARADYFSNVTVTTVTGSAAASGLNESTQTTSTSPAASFSTVNSSAISGSASTSEATAQNTFINNGTELSVGVQAGTTFNSPQWEPVSETASATLTVTFQVPVTGTYDLSGQYTQPGDSYQVQHQTKSATLSGGGNNYSYAGDFDDNGQFYFVTELPVTLDAGTTYTLSATGNCSSLNDSNLTVDNGFAAAFTVTAVPEPTSLALIGISAVPLLLRRRKHHTIPAWHQS